MNERFYTEALSAFTRYSGRVVDLHTEHNVVGKPCYACIHEMEVELGFAEKNSHLPKPPSGPGGGSPIHTINELRSMRDKDISDV